jgi:hypothetical protein
MTTKEKKRKRTLRFKRDRGVSGGVGGGGYPRKESSTLLAKWSVVETAREWRQQAGEGHMP